MFVHVVPLTSLHYEVCQSIASYAAYLDIFCAVAVTVDCAV